MIHIIAIKHLNDFIDDHPNYRMALEAWISIVKSCNWEKPQDIVNEFGSKAIDLLGKKNKKKSTTSCNRVVFDIKGNNIRIIAKYQFHPSLKKSILYLKWIGTHVEYDKLCDQNRQYEVDMF
jgi:mRNA interferase HigB